MCVCHISNAPTNGEKEDLLIAPWPQNKARLFITHPTTSALDMKLVKEAYYVVKYAPGHSQYGAPLQ